MLQKKSNRMEKIEIKIWSDIYPWFFLRLLINHIFTYTNFWMMQDSSDSQDSREYDNPEFKICYRCA